MNTTNEAAVAGPVEHPVMPCNMGCDKCGSNDVYRRFVPKGNVLDNRKYYESPSRFADPHGYTSVAFREHIMHLCRCCGHAWETLPLPKKRRKANGA